ncbi:MAG: preprotein translocase subunit SecG [Bacteroidales bacterium]|nr:preprotein translocase subunit SecG [Bacteroidales bacterium]
MNGIFIFLTVIVIIASILLTIVVLLQNGKGGGLASNFVAGNQTFGVRQTADFLEKFTWVLVAIVFLVSIATAFTTGTKNHVEGDSTKAIIESEEATPDAFAPEQIVPTDVETPSSAE